MQLQFHPASGRGTVRTISLGESGERVLAAAAAVVALFAVSLWFTVPSVSRRLGREREKSDELARSAEAAGEWQSVARAAADLRRRARNRADLENRIAFLYGVPPAQWPKALAPENRLLADESPDRIASGLPVFLAALEKGRVILARRELESPGAVRQVPAILPLGDALFEPSAYFGPRRSPWTNEEEFLSGVEIAAPPGSSVVAPGDAVVAFAGTIRRSLGGSLWQLGNVVILSHGAYGATVFGHLARVDVRRGQKVVRGARLGTVGVSGWALSPQLHYEYWRNDGERLRPTDPLFAVLDLPLERKPYSLERMAASWAPGPLDSLPGIDVRADEAAAPGPSAPRRSRRTKL